VTDIEALIPVFARLVNDFPDIVALLPFNGYGRDTGYGSHPEVHAHWQQLVASVPGTPELPGTTPPVEPGPEPPEPEKPEPPKPVDPPPVQPTPPTEEVDMIVAYGQIQPGFASCTEVDNGNGTISLQKPNGKFVAVTPEGSVEERDTPGGVWESFRKGNNCVIAERDGEAKGPLVYVLMAVDI
jgi:hypothetical protein